MKDTHPAIEELYFRMIMRCSPEERFRMGLEMYEVVRRLVTASILQNRSDAKEKDIKVALLERFYGNDLPAEIKPKVIEQIKARNLQDRLIEE